MRITATTLRSHRRPTRFLMTVLVCLLFFNSITKNASAWVYPEHRQIALLAIQNLSPEYRNLLDQYRNVARTGFGKRLTASVIDTPQGVKPAQFDYASWADWRHYL